LSSSSELALNQRRMPIRMKQVPRRVSSNIANPKLT
jgi:hypothetical protein